MKNYKYEINETLYPAGCSEEYQKRNTFHVAYRKKQVVLLDDTPYSQNLYSENGLSWFLETCLTQQTASI
mgnify:FL=1